MTISTTDNTTRSTASEGQTVFPYTFKVLDEDHMKVYVDDTLQSSGYSVSSVGNDNGGNVTFTTAPRASGAAAVTVTLQREVPLTQETDLPTTGALNTAALEEQLDLTIMAMQQLDEVDARSFKVPVESTVSGANVEVTPVANGYLAFNASATGITVVSAITAPEANVTAFVSTLLDDTDADAFNVTLHGIVAADAGKTLVVNPDGDGVVKAGPIDPFRNLLRNASFQVAQRGSVAGMGAASAYALDGWCLTLDGTNAARVTISRDTDVPTGRKGYSLKIDCTTIADTIDAGDCLTVACPMEAQFLQHLNWGLSTARPLTLSFWFKSPKSGTHAVALYGADGARSHVREFNVTTADTWEFETVTFTGDTAGTITNDTGEGLRLAFPLIAGTDFRATANAWAAGEDYATSNQQNLLDNTSNNILIHAPQLEVGSVATAFETIPADVEEMRARRYLRRITGETAVPAIAAGLSRNSTVAAPVMTFDRPMRAAPTLSTSAASDFVLVQQNTTIATTAITASAATYGVEFSVTVASGMTAGEAVTLRVNDTKWLQLSAELAP